MTLKTERPGSLVTTHAIGDDVHTGRSVAAFVLLMFSIGCRANSACALTDLTANRELDSQIGCNSPWPNMLE